MPPTTSDTDAGATETVCTVAGGGGAGALTVTVAAPFLPPLVAVIVAEPAATADTSPVALTVATALLLLVHAAV